MFLSKSNYYPSDHGIPMEGDSGADPPSAARPLPDLDLKDLDGLMTGLEEGSGSGSESDPGPKSLKDYMKLVAPHVGLVLVVALYAVCGALVFLTVEGPHETAVRASGIEDIDALREDLVERLWNLSPKGARPSTQSNWSSAASGELNNLTRRLFRAFSTEFVLYSDLRVDGNRSATPPQLWTTSSAIFFAATTMATIGYGNIVPVTSVGRVICIFFALVGAPLAIITIGDLGKFLSECTIWLYRKLRRLREMARAKFRPGGVEAAGSVASDLEKGSRSPTASGSDAGDSMDELEEMLMDKTQVPVVLVFGILLVYIALGACLFALLEGWGWLDAFYFCFITLTTVGFGDLVPQQHQFILIMLIYIGVGLAVTTMCIDLVGIQYIQKIHYFGRKFRGADLLAMLKRRRAIERQLAMAQQDGMMHMYLQEQPTPEWKTPSPASVYSSPDDWRGSDASSWSPPRGPSPASTAASVLARAAMYASPNRSFDTASPSGPDISLDVSLATSPDVEERMRLYDRRLTTRSSWTESGPDPSPPNISLDSDGSVTARESEWRSFLRSPSAASFAFEFPVDMAAIAKLARAARKNRSCPDRFVPLPPPSQAILDAQILQPPLCTQFPEPPTQLPPPLRPTLFARPTSDRRVQLPTPEISRCVSEDAIASAQSSRFEPRAAREKLLPLEPPNCPTVTQERLPLIQKAKIQSGGQMPDDEAPIFVPQIQLLRSRPLDSRRQSSVLLQPHPIREEDRRRSLPRIELSSAEMVAVVRGEMARILRAGVPKPVGISQMEEWDSFQQMERDSRRPRPPQLLVNSPSPPPDDEPPPLLSALTTPLSSPAESEMDFGAFELLPGSSVTSADLRADDAAPLIFHGELPVHSVHHQTVKTETAVLSLLACPDASLAADLPPFVVTDNYCFVVDGSGVPEAAISGDTKFWRHTSRPTKYYFSDDLRRFQKVNVLQSRGKVISARFPKTRTPSLVLGMSEAPGSPRLSSSASSSLGGLASPRKDNEAPLANVFKVIRSYSFWKTCTSFHRIVTLVDPVLEDSELALIKKRLFIQYLWRNAKDSDKKRVAREFDPAKQIVPGKRKGTKRP